MPAERFFLLLLWAVLTCGGITAVSQPGALFGPWRECLEKWAERRHWRPYLAKPILLCDTCLASVWGAGVYVVYGHFIHYHMGWVTLAEYGVPFLFATALCNYALWNLLGTLRALSTVLQLCQHWLKSAVVSAISSSARSQRTTPD